MLPVDSPHAGMRDAAARTAHAVSLTVAVCTHNRAAQLATTLEGIRALARPAGGWELLVVDNASRDDTPTLLHGEDWRPPGVKVRVVREEALGVANARNRAMRDAAGDYVLFIDDDETPDAQWLVAYERAIRASQADALGGPIDVRFVDGERPAWLTDELLGFLGRLDHGPEPMSLAGGGTPIFTGNSAFRRAAVAKLGMFDAALGRRGEANDGGEDVDLYRRMAAAGCTMQWVPDARIFHRIHAGKLRRGYFLDLHFRQGRMEGRRARGTRGRIPPAYVVPQLWRAATTALRERFARGRAFSLRKEMNVAYFAGYVTGWMGD